MGRAELGQASVLKTTGSGSSGAGGAKLAARLLPASPGRNSPGMVTAQRGSRLSERHREPNMITPANTWVTECGRLPLPDYEIRRTDRATRSENVSRAASTVFCTSAASR